MSSARAATAVDPALVQAYEAGTLGFGFSGGGFLIFYLVGVIEALTELGVLIPGETKVAGTSAGALTTVGVCSALPPQRLREVCLSLAARCQRPGHCASGLGKEVRRAFDTALPNDSYKKCRNTGYINMSIGKIGAASPLMVGDYTSDEDLKNAAIASSWIPYWSGGLPHVKFRGQPAFDGYMTGNLPCPPGVTQCVKVSLDAYGFARSTGKDFFTCAARAMRDQDGSSRNAQRLPSLPAEASYDRARVTAAFSSSGFDIQPNVYTPLPFSRDDWECMKFTPATTPSLTYMVELGRRDATAWAKDTGLAAAARAKGRASG